MTQDELEYEIWSSWQMGYDISLRVCNNGREILAYVGKYDYEKNGVVCFTVGHTEVKVLVNAYDLDYFQVFMQVISITLDGHHENPA